MVIPNLLPLLEAIVIIQRRIMNWIIFLISKCPMFFWKLTKAFWGFPVVILPLLLLLETIIMQERILSWNMFLTSTYPVSGIFDG